MDRKGVIELVLTLPVRPVSLTVLDVIALQVQRGMTRAIATSLDELPSRFSIVRGDKALVGQQR